MLQRRGRAVSFQAEHRARTKAVLRNLLGSDNQKGYVEVSIGPRILTEPLIELQGLRDRAFEFSAPSHYHSGHRFPITRMERMEAMLESVFCVNRVGAYLDSVGSIDVYGNIVLIKRLIRELNYHHMVHPMDRERVPKFEGKALGIDGGLAFEQVLCTIHSALNRTRRPTSSDYVSWSSARRLLTDFP